MENIAYLLFLWLVDLVVGFFCCCFGGFVLVVLELELRVLSLLGRQSTTWATPLALIALVIF
jgi:hypothetical protein